MKNSAKKTWIGQVVLSLLLIGLIGYILTKEPKRPALPRWERQEKILEIAKTNKTDKAKSQKNQDLKFVKQLLGENLSQRSFYFADVVEASSGKRIIPFVEQPGKQRISAAIDQAMEKLVHQFNQESSAIRKLGRINEASRLFEDALIAELDKIEGFRCGVPQTRGGTLQRSGYPDLVIADEKTGGVFYLDPKLYQIGSEASGFRSFYFEPKVKTLKITENASHLVLGIAHDGKDGAWQFLKWRLVDISQLQVRLKAEFQASNKQLYEVE